MPSIRPHRFLFALGLSFTLLASPSLSQAAKAKKKKAKSEEVAEKESAASKSKPRKIVVAPLAGNRVAPIRRHLVQSVESGEGIEIVEPEEVKSKAAALSVDPNTPEGKVKISKELGISAWVRAKVKKEGKVWVAELSVLNGATGEALGQWSVQAASKEALSKELEEGFWANLGNAVEQSSPPHETSEAVAEAESTEEAPPQERAAVEQAKDDEALPMQKDDAADESKPRPRAFTLSIEGGIFVRRLVFEGQAFPQLTNYRLDPVPIVTAEMQWFPFAHFTRGAGAHFGIDLRGDTSFGLHTNDGINSVEFPTRAWGFFAGGRLRLPIRRHELFAVTGYGIQRFDIRNTGGVQQSVYPSVDYRYLRMEVGGRFYLVGGLSWRFRGAWLYGLSSGDISDAPFLADAKVGAVEGNTGLGYEFGRGVFELRASFFIRHYSFSLDSQPVNPFASDVAVDRYLGGYGGFAIHLPPR